nr:ribonuclease P protein component 4 [Stygiolobus caldivivus]
MKVMKEHKRRAIELIDLAIKEAEKNELDLARRYVSLAVNYANKYKFKLPLKYKRKFCRKCFTPLIPGLTERRRIKNKVIVVSCVCCGWIRRYPVKKTDKGS